MWGREQEGNLRFKKHLSNTSIYHKCLSINSYQIQIYLLSFSQSRTGMYFPLRNLKHIFPNTPFYSGGNFGLFPVISDLCKQFKQFLLLHLMNILPSIHLTEPFECTGHWLYFNCNFDIKCYHFVG